MTDIVDSTRLWATHEAEMAVDLEAHDRLLREAIARAGGEVAKHTGDGAIAVFAEPRAAAGAAAAIQRQVASAPWRVPAGLRLRAAVHSGAVYRRDEDVFGTAVNRLARLVELCPPGAVLVSAVAAGLLTERGAEDGGASLKPAGAARLPGFGTAEDVFALAGTGLAVVERVGAERAPPSNLPPIQEALVGRGGELARIWEALARQEPVTLLGIGGMGKTRLALEVAHGMSGSLRDGAWWIDLTLATSGSAVVAVAAAALRVEEMAGRTLLEGIVERLSDADGLMVLDNCEHVLEEARALVMALRGSCRGLRVMCTSREALAARGELVLPIGSLDADEAAALYQERVRVARGGMATPDEAATAAAICARLDRIPLAIELAAARRRSMSAEDILERLDQRFRLLRSGRAGAERHRTLSAAIAWSYESLGERERLVFGLLSVFAGGTLLDGLASVAGLDEFDALDAVDRLVACSMVATTDTPLGIRYGQLETLRLYAEDRLAEAGQLMAARDAHLAWMGALAKQAETGTDSATLERSFRRTVAEFPNLRVAVAHARGQARQGEAVAILAGMSRHLLYAHAIEVIDWFDPPGDARGWNVDVVAVAGLCTFLEIVTKGPELGRERLAAVPDDMKAAHTRMVHARFISALYSGSPAEAGDVLDTYTPRGRHDALVIDNFRIMLDARIAAAEPLPAGRREAMLEAARARVASCRDHGDPLLLGMALSAHGRLALRLDAEADAMQALREANVIGVRIGSSMLILQSAGLMTGLVAEKARRGEAMPLDAVREVRTYLADLLARGVPMYFFRLVFGADRVALLVRDLDAEAGALMLEVIARSGFEASVPNVAAGAPADGLDPRQLERIRDLAARIGPREAARQILAAIDRWIARSSPPGP